MDIHSFFLSFFQRSKLVEKLEATAADFYFIEANAPEDVLKQRLKDRE